MATKKTETKKKTDAKKKTDKVTYNGQTYTVLDRTETKLMLTDGLIHFWVKADRVKA